LGQTRCGRYSGAGRKERAETRGDEFEFLGQAIGKDARVVFDVGAKYGHYTGQFLRLFPEATVYAVDCAPRAVARLAEDFGEHERVQVVPLAFDSYGAKYPFHICQMAGSSSLHPITDLFGQETRTTETIQVVTITLEEFCARQDIRRIDLLKIDTEGNDLRVLQGAHRLLEEQRIGAVHVELLFFPYYKSQCWYYEVSEFLVTHDFELRAMWPTYWGGRLRYAQAFFGRVP
jgi:FkbM family methyltransferase